MTNNKLLNILGPEQISGQLLLIHASNDDYPLADFVLQQLKNKIEHYHKQYFTVERFFDFALIHNIMQSISLFAEPNYIQLNFKTKPNAEQQKQLLGLLDSLDTNNFLVIVCDKLNKTEQNSSWFKEIANTGITININSADAEPLISYLFKQQNLSISNEGMNTLINQNQGNFSQLLNEANKLTWSVTAGHTIGISDIAKFTSDNAQYNVYQLSTNYLAGNLAQSLKMLENLYQDSSDAILILWVLQEDIKRLLKIKSKLRTNNNIRQIMQEMRLWGESVDQLPLAEKRIGYKTLIEIYGYLAQLDMAVKGVLNLDIQLLLITIIKRICGK